MPPSLSSTAPVLTLKVLHPGNLLRPWKTGMIGHRKVQPLWVGHSIYVNPVCGLNMKLALISGILASITQERSHFLLCLCLENAQDILLESHTFGPDAPARHGVKLM